MLSHPLRPAIRLLVIFALLTGSCGAGDFEPPITALDVLGFEIDPRTWGHAELDDARAYEERVQRCMAEMGFEYVVDSDLEAQSRRERPDFDDDDWVAEFGFGISTMFFDTQPDNRDSRSTNAPGPQRNDVQETAYQIALRGKGDTVGGCEGSAARYISKRSKYLEVFREDLEELAQEVPDHPQVLSALADVGECMIAAGYDLITPPQAMAHFDQSVQLIAQADPGLQQPERVEELAELQSDERRVAHQLQECGGLGPGQLTDAYSRAWLEIEQRFVAETAAWTGEQQ